MILIIITLEKIKLWKENYKERKNVKILKRKKKSIYFVYKVVVHDEHRLLGPITSPIIKHRPKGRQYHKRQLLFRHLWKVKEHTF